MSFLGGVLNVLDTFNPVSKLLDVAGDALGLPPEMKHALKIGGGIFTGNVVMVATGVVGAAEDAARMRAATTEYPTGAGGAPGAAPSGYAPATPAGGAPRQSGTLDPSILEYRDALRTLHANFETFDTLYGSNNDKFDLNTLARARSDTRLPAKVREAAAFLVSHPEYRNQLDTAHKGGRVDGTISRKDVDQALRNVEKAIAQHGVREPAPCGTPPAPGTPSPGTPAPGSPPHGSPPPCGGTPVPGTPPPSSPPSVPGGSGSPLDPEIHDYLSALETLEANFSTMDGAAGPHDGQLTLAELRGMANDARLSPRLRSAAQFLVSNPGYFERLDAASPGSRPLRFQPTPTIPGHSPGGANDDAFDLGAVRSERSRVEADLKTYGSPARPGASNGGSGARAPADVASILDDPGMSLEEKVELVLSQILESSDAEIAQTMDELAAAQNKSASAAGGPGGNAAAQQSQTSVEKLNLKLQKLMEKRKAMFELMSNMSTKFNEMAKTAISNLGRA